MGWQDIHGASPTQMCHRSKDAANTLGTHLYSALVTVQNRSRRAINHNWPLARSGLRRYRCRRLGCPSGCTWPRAAPFCSQSPQLPPLLVGDNDSKKSSLALQSRSTIYFHARQRAIPLRSPHYRTGSALPRRYGRRYENSSSAKALLSSTLTLLKLAVAVRSCWLYYADAVKPSARSPGRTPACGRPL